MRRFNVRPRSLDVYLRSSGVVSDPAIMTLSRLRDVDAGSKKSQLSRKSSDGVSWTHVHGGRKSALSGDRRQQEVVFNAPRDDMQELPDTVDSLEIQDDAFDDDDLIGKISRYT